MHEVHVELVIIGGTVGRNLVRDCKRLPGLAPVRGAEQIPLGRLPLGEGARGGGKGIDHAVSRCTHAEGGASRSGVDGTGVGDRGPSGAPVRAQEQGASTVAGHVVGEPAGGGLHEAPDPPSRRGHGAVGDTGIRGAEEPGVGAHQDDVRGLGGVDFDVQDLGGGPQGDVAAPGAATVGGLDHEAADTRIEGIAGPEVERAAAAAEGHGPRHGAANLVGKGHPDRQSRQEIGGLPESAARGQDIDRVARGVRGIRQDRPQSAAVHLVERDTVLDEVGGGWAKAHPGGALRRGREFPTQIAWEEGRIPGPLLLGLGEEAVREVGAQVAAHALSEPLPAAPGLVLDLCVAAPGKALVVDLVFGLVGIVLGAQRQGRQECQNDPDTGGRETHGNSIGDPRDGSRRLDRYQGIWRS